MVNQQQKHDAGHEGIPSYKYLADAPTLAFVSYRDRQPVLGFHIDLQRWVSVPTLFFHGDSTFLEAHANGLYVHDVCPLLEYSNPADIDWVLESIHQLVVSNPWTCTTRWLPLRPNDPSDLLTLFTIDVAKNGTTYKITGISACTQRGVVYDSQLRSWTDFYAPFDSTPAMANMKLEPKNETKSKCVRLQGSLYFVVHDQVASPKMCRSCHSNRYVIAFHLETRKWALVYDMRIAMPERFSKCVASAKHGACHYLPLCLTACDNKLVVLSVLHKKTGTGGRLLALDVERNVMLH